MSALARLLLFLFLPFAALGFSWNSQKALHSHHREPRDPSEGINVIPLPNRDRDADSLYETALRELESLESQPLCHRMAARLLVNNCHLLHGSDEALELADSGRLARDFIDSYAASLAICDLERGSFAIPRECVQFREVTLAKLSATKSPYLHVSTQEIDRCLEGLAQSDASWNTWVSYRHKAVRFCEIAKSENDKDSTIRLHKKVTEIMERFTDEVEVQIEEKLRRVDDLVQKTANAADLLLPRTESLQSQLQSMDRLLSGQLLKASENSAIAMKTGLEDATQLQLVVNILLQSIRESQVQFSMEHSNALQTLRTETFNGMETMIATIATAASSSVRLQTQLEETELQAGRVIERQDRLEKNLDRLQELSKDLLVSHNSHQNELDSAHHSVMNILGTLQNVESSTDRISGAILRGTSWSWWPHIICPAASLYLGSYRLAPSIARNLILLGLGEIAGVAVAAFQADPLGTVMPSIHTTLPFIFKYNFNETKSTIKESHNLHSA